MTTRHCPKLFVSLSLGRILSYLCSLGCVCSGRLVCSVNVNCGVQDSKCSPRVCNQSNIIIFLSYFDRGFPWSFAMSFWDTTLTFFSLASRKQSVDLYWPTTSSPFPAKSLATVSMGQVEGGLGTGRMRGRFSKFWECLVLRAAASTLTRSNPVSLSCSRAL